MRPLSLRYIAKDAVLFRRVAKTFALNPEFPLFVPASHREFDLGTTARARNAFWSRPAYWVTMKVRRERTLTYCEFGFFPGARKGSLALDTTCTTFPGVICHDNRGSQHGPGSILGHTSHRETRAYTGHPPDTVPSSYQEALKATTPLLSSTPPLRIAPTCLQNAPVVRLQSSTDFKMNNVDDGPGIPLASVTPDRRGAFLSNSVMRRFLRIKADDDCCIQTKQASCTRI